MKHEIVEADAARGIVRITTSDSRWYAREVSEGESGKKRWDFVPSVTWITDSAYPKDIGYYRWLASKGWDEAESIRIAAGEKGDKVHQGVRILSTGGTIERGDSLINPTTGEPEEITTAEYVGLMSFQDWCREERPVFLKNEYTVWSARHRYAGTTDIKCLLKSTGYKVVHVVDVKTSPHIYTPMILQVSAYKHADDTLPKRGVKLGILQLGYKYNKIKKYKYTEVPDKFPLFLAAKKIWAYEQQGVKPQQKDYPMILSLAGLASIAGEA